MTITEFLLDRIEEDEERARSADSGRWLPEDKGVTFEFYGDEFPDGEAQVRLVADTRANQNHIARWGPARVLAECAAKRAILTLFKSEDVKEDWSIEAAYAAGVDDCIRALAAVYADHPDYENEWAQ